MFTSISALRNSHAMQDRVSSVERNLKKLNPQWKPEFLFPVAVVGLSNSVDDVEWVEYNTSVLLKSGPTRYYPAGLLSAGASAAELIKALEAVHPRHISRTQKTIVINTALVQINAAIARAFGVAAYDWSKNPITDVQTVADDAAPSSSEPVEAPAKVKVEAKAEPVAAVASGAALSLQHAFEIVFKGDKLNFEKNASGKGYATDRVQGKYLGFVKTVQALKGNVLNLADVAA
jgi:hypothetical protein